jgi:phosphoribosylamine--glycine ligase
LADQQLTDTGTVNLFGRVEREQISFSFSHPWFSCFIAGRMNVLVIGSGGREHALVWKLAQSPRITRLWCAPGNAGIAQERLTANGAAVECTAIGAEDLPGLLKFASDQRLQLTVVGPDNPLALGIVDLFQKNGLRIWGPNQRAAQFEASKVFAQEFMDRHGIPTMKSAAFTDAKSARQFAASLGGGCAVKADGLALGKGVLICQSQTEADRAIDEILVTKAFGKSGDRILIQELIEGMEVSLHFLCDGRTALLFPSSQDHKRALDGDQGLNTGGMGTYSPAPFLSAAELRAVGDAVIQPWLAGCAKEGIDYRGILYPGVMLTSTGPKVIEFNSRFGDPEAQVYLPRLQSDLLDLLEASVDGTLDRAKIEWSTDACVCVVMASGGYPGNYSKGKAITGLAAADALPKTKVFHAGTALHEGRVVTNGGRVLGVTAWAATLPAARDAAYAAIPKIQFDGAHFRRDIAAKALR